MNPTIKFLEDRIAYLKKREEDEAYGTGSTDLLQAVYDHRCDLQRVAATLKYQESKAVALLRLVPTDLHPDDPRDGWACLCSQCSLRRSVAAFLTKLGTP